MMRWLITCVLLCGGVVAAIYFTSPLRSPSAAAGGAKDANAANDHGSGSPEGRSPLGGVKVLPGQEGGGVQLGGTLDVADARVTVPDKTDVPAERDGKILFIGTEFKPGEYFPREPELSQKILEGKIYRLEVRFLALELQPTDPAPPMGEEVLLYDAKGNPDGKRYRRWKEGDRLDAGKLKVCKEVRYYRKLEMNDRVKKGDLLALINPALALDDLLVKASKLEAADADWLASSKTRDEAERRYYRDRGLRSRGANNISEDDLRASELAWQRYAEEAKAKAAAISSAQQELNQSITVLKMHEVRAVTSGMVSQFYKHTGDAIKNLDPLLELRNVDQPRVEGAIGVQHALKLRETMERLKPLGKAVRVSVEVSRQPEPRRVLERHNRAVTAVAVSAGDHPFVVSGDEGGDLRGWNAETGRLVWTSSGAPVRSLACSPAGAPGGDRALVGLSDGIAYLLTLDLDQLAKSQGAKGGSAGRWVLGGEDDGGEPNKAHRGPVNCVAFSPDGKWCATGGEDRSIAIWDATDPTKSPRRIPEAHGSPVTSLQFAANNELVSAGRDGAMWLWKLAGDGDPRRHLVADYRSNSVPQLGLYRGDGTEKGERLVLLDLGKELRVVSLDSRQTVPNGVLSNPTGSGNFATMALFSPDGRTILTNNPGDGKLQLWRAPGPDKRAYEQRQLLASGAGASASSSATCGAFGQRLKDNFAVTGTQDGRVLIWDLPSAEEAPIEAALNYLQRDVDNQAQRADIWAEPTHIPVPAWVQSGSRATLAIHLDETVQVTSMKP
jgi:WD40 repeat protein